MKWALAKIELRNNLKSFQKLQYVSFSGLHILNNKNKNKHQMQLKKKKKSLFVTYEVNENDNQQFLKNIHNENSYYITTY